MTKAVTVTVEAIDKSYGYTIVEVKAQNAKPMSFTVQYDENTGQYIFDQTGENNRWVAFPDERK